jgi:hypothetical protein
VYLAIGNSLYFFGRSHEHNILNISAILITVLFIAFDTFAFDKESNGKFKNLIIKTLPLLFIFSACYFYGDRINSKIKTQVNNGLKGKFIFQNKDFHVPINEMKLIHFVTHKSKKVYFLNTFNDFKYYYSGKYSPKGHFLPTSTWVIKKEYTQFLQNLLDNNYYLITTDFDEIKYLLPSLRYSEIINEKQYSFIKK